MAQRVKFTKDFDYRVSHSVEKAYKKGYEGLVPEAHYEAAKAAGAVEVPAEKKPKADEPRKA